MTWARGLPMRVLTARERRAVLTRYQAGEAIARIVTATGVGYPIVRRTLRQAGIEPEHRHVRHACTPACAALVAAYRAGESSPRLAARLGCTRQGAWTFLRRHGVTLRSQMDAQALRSDRR